jgi:hypothetical protein
MTFHTGDLPQQAFGDHSLSWRAVSFLWGGCLDAPDALPAGSHCGSWLHERHPKLAEEFGDEWMSAPRSVRRPD